MPVVSENDNYLYRQILKFIYSFTGQTPVVFSIITFTLLFLQASIFNRISNHHKLLAKPSFLPGMAYMLVTSLFVSWNYFSAPLLVNTFMMWIWYRMLNLYNSHQPGSAIFNIGILLGLTSMVYFPAIFFTILMLFTLLIMRPFRMREWVVGIIGITIPYYFLFILLYLTGKWKWSIVLPKIDFSLPIIPTSIWITISMALLVIVFIMGGFYVQANLSKMLIQVRKSWSLLLLYLIVVTGMIFIDGDNEYRNWMLTALPFAAFHSAAYFYPTQKIFPTVLHWVVFLYVIILMYRFS